LEANVADASLVILAAGLGSRYGGLKQIDPIGPNGEWLIEYSIYDALAVGIKHVIFVIQGIQEAAFQETLGNKLVGRCRVSFAHQAVADVPSGIGPLPKREKPWGTGHAVLSARRWVEGPFAVINADDFYGRESYAHLAQFLAHADRSPDAYAMVGFDLRKTLAAHGTVSRGVCRVGTDGLLIGIDERTKVGIWNDVPVFWDREGTLHKLPDISIVSMNMWAFPQVFMEELAVNFEQFLSSPNTDPVRDEFFLPSAVSELAVARRARVRVLPTTATWMGVTYREDLDRVRRGIQTMIDAGVYPQHLWNHKV